MQPTERVHDIPLRPLVLSRNAREARGLVECAILERTPSGKLAFVLYMNTFHHTLPDLTSLAL